MSENINQVYIANPITSNLSTDLMYFGRSPYGASDDTAMTYSNFAAQFGSPYTPAALTSANDTNVTLTLGGTPATSLLHAASITAGWTGLLSPARGGTGVNNGTNTITVHGNFDMSGAFTFVGTLVDTTAVTFPTSGILATTSQIPSLPLSLSNGGTGASLVASNGGIFYSNGTAGAILSGTATANQVLLSGSNSAPSWSTATYPSTTTISQILYSSSANVIAGLSTANSAVLVTNSTGVPSLSSTMTNGQLIIGSTSATPTAATLTAGTGISITNGAASITIASTASGMAWSTIAGTTQAAAVDNGYIIGNSSQTTVTLPATAAIGSSIILCGSPTGTAGWFLTANSGQTIKIGGSTTSTAGSLQSANQLDNVAVVCIVANTTWMVTSTVSTGLLVT